MTSASVVILVDVAFVVGTAVVSATAAAAPEAFAWAFTLPKIAAAMVKIMAANKIVLPALSLFSVLVFMMFSFRVRLVVCCLRFVSRLLMSPL